MPKALRIWANVVALLVAGLMAYLFVQWAQNSAVDKHWEQKVTACVTEMNAEQLGHSTGEKPCAVLDDAGKREAAYRWAKERGAL
jgi:hypothetical protein